MIRKGSRQADDLASAIVTLASDHADLALHALAHLALPRGDPANLRDPRYVEWAARTLPADAVDPIVHDAPLVAAAYARDPLASRAIFALPLVHDSIDAFLRSATRDLAELADDEVDDLESLAAVRTTDPTLCELLRCAMALAGPAYRTAHRTALSTEVALARERASPWLSRAIEIMPALADRRIVLTHPLGVHGRGLGTTILVGAPVPWNGLGAEHPAILTLHERAVAEASREAASAGALPEDLWAIAETRALAAVAEMVRGTDLEAAYGQWRSTLDTRSLEAAAARLAVDSDPRALVDRLRAPRA